MSGKTLSTGTLSLRFMQNAHRAKQLAEVEAEQAQVKDEAEWEVAKEVREAWGIGAGSRAVGQSVSYETSYIPFLFDRDVAKPKGRRTFDKRGHEAEEAKAEDERLSLDQAQATGHTTDVRSKGPKRPISISGSSSAVYKPLTKDAKKIKDPSKTAKQMIRDSSGVGTDLHATSSSVRSPPPQSISLGRTFMKPSGVDEPSNKAKESTSRAQDSGITSGSGLKGKESSKRARETVTEPRENEGKKRKKKKIVE